MKKLHSYYLLSIITTKTFFGGNHKSTGTYAFTLSKSKLRLTSTCRGIGRSTSCTRLFSSTNDLKIIQDEASRAKNRHEDGDGEIGNNLKGGDGVSDKSTNEAIAGNNVKVRVQRDLPNLSSPMEAKDTWLSYVWSKGGGLPVWVIPKNDDIGEVMEHLDEDVEDKT